VIFEFEKAQPQHLGRQHMDSVQGMLRRTLNCLVALSPPNYTYWPPNFCDKAGVPTQRITGMRIKYSKTTVVQGLVSQSE
jgi:hypothetical protein